MSKFPYIVSNALCPPPPAASRIYYPDTERKLHMYQVSNIEIVWDVSILCLGYRYRIGFDFPSISNTTLPYQYMVIMSTVKEEYATVRSCTRRAVRSFARRTRAGSP